MNKEKFDLFLKNQKSYFDSSAGTSPLNRLKAFFILWKLLAAIPDNLINGALDTETNEIAQLITTFVREFFSVEKNSEQYKQFVQDAIKLTNYLPFVSILFEISVLTSLNVHHILLVG